MIQFIILDIFKENENGHTGLSQRQTMPDI